MHLAYNFPRPTNRTAYITLPNVDMNQRPIPQSSGAKQPLERRLPTSRHRDQVSRSAKQDANDKLSPTTPDSSTTEEKSTYKRLNIKPTMRGGTSKQWRGKYGKLRPPINNRPRNTLTHLPTKKSGQWGNLTRAQTQ